MAIPPILVLLTMPLGGWVRWDQLVDVLKEISLAPSDVRPITGDWGWTAVISGGSWDLTPWKLVVGQYLIYAVAAFCLWWWRKADPIDVSIAILLGFMVVTPRLGARYLLLVHAVPGRPPHRVGVAGHHRQLARGPRPAISC